MILWYKRLMLGCSLCIVSQHIPLIFAYCMQTVNSLRPCDICMRQRAGSTLVQVMVCRLLGGKPMPEPMMTYWQFVLMYSHLMKFNSKCVQIFLFKKSTSKSVAFLFWFQCVKCCFRTIITLVSYWGRVDLSYGKNKMLPSWRNDSHYSICSSNLFVAIMPQRY